MPTPPPKNKGTDLTEELEKKLSDIGNKEQELTAGNLAKELSLPYSDLHGLPVDPEALNMITPEEAHKAQAAPVQTHGSTVILVVADPRNKDTEALVEKMGRRFKDVRSILVSPVSLAKVLVRYEQLKTAEIFEVGATPSQGVRLDRHCFDGLGRSEFEIMCNWISEVPSKIFVRRASRQYRSNGSSVV